MPVLYGRSRNGCFTCKIRKVKCDETDPSCMRCLSTGQTCDGYFRTQALPMIDFANDSERRSYQYLREEVLPRISSHYDQPFWQEWILRIRSSQPAIRHALMAVASVHESLQLALEEEVPWQGQSQNSFALQQYNQAIALLTSKALTPLSTEVMLTACLVFVTLESLLGQMGAASEHLQNGLKIIRQWKPRTESERDLIANYFAPFLLRGATDRTTASVPDNGHLVAPLAQMTENGPIFLLPAKFLSFHHARNCLHALLEEIFLAIEGTRTETHLSTLIAYIKSAENILQEWVAKFNFVPSHTEERKFLRGSLLVRLQHRLATILVTTIPCTNEMLFDTHSDTFRDILSLCEEFIELENQTHSSLKPGYSAFAFTFDFGILPALYTTPFRCREPSIRREAISLLRRIHRREGLFKSDAAVLLAEKTILLEESGLEEVRSCTDVPRTHRVRVSAIRYDPGCTKAKCKTQATWSSGCVHLISRPEQQWRNVASHCRPQRRLVYEVQAILHGRSNFHLIRMWVVGSRCQFGLS